MSQTRAAIILAAGQGTRMKSSLAKPLHRVGGRSMLDWTLDLADRAGVSREATVVVWGAHSPAVKERAEAAGAKAALQDPPMGTGHAVEQAREALQAHDGPVVILYGDTPLIRPETVEAVFTQFNAGGDHDITGLSQTERLNFSAIRRSQ